MTNYVDLARGIVRSIVELEKQPTFDCELFYEKLKQLEVCYLSPSIVKGELFFKKVYDKYFTKENNSYRLQVHKPTLELMNYISKEASISLSIKEMIPIYRFPLRDFVIENFTMYGVAVTRVVSNSKMVSAFNSKESRLLYDLCVTIHKRNEEAVAELEQQDIRNQISNILITKDT